jgi:hypothetical protein
MTESQDVAFDVHQATILALIVNLEGRQPTQAKYPDRGIGDG